MVDTWLPNNRVILVDTPELSWRPKKTLTSSSGEWKSHQSSFSLGRRCIKIAACHLIHKIIKYIFCRARSGLDGCAPINAHFLGKIIESDKVRYGQQHKISHSHAHFFLLHKKVNFGLP
jgi:hypothetical protein